ncbi:MAG TPA: hypothetical protein VM077_04395 [Candidatus Limnocylindrales bacterium]|nr:hypothetical protein [Candidatus Limnocylindrales bacterium]
MNLEKILQNKYIFLIFVCLGLAAILFLRVQQSSDNVKRTVKPMSEISQKQYQIFAKKYLQIVKSQGPRSAVEKLKIESEKDPATLYYCHDLMHDVGKEAILQLKDFSKAASYQDATCVSGYIHGVLQEYFSTADDVQLAMKSVCQDHKKDDFFAWECYHGVGHGLMYFSDNNLPESIVKCSSYSTSFARVACTNGVYMENFTADEKNHPTRFRKASDPFYPCKEQKDEYKAGCYQNAPIYYLTLNDFNYDDALKWCKNAEKDFRYICYVGVGSQATRKNMQNIKYVESVCARGNSQQKNWCISGIVSYYIGHYGTVDKAEMLCSKFEKSNQGICKNAVKLHAQAFR